jgi:hypothetical protein
MYELDIQIVGLENAMRVMQSTIESIEVGMKALGEKTATHMGEVIKSSAKRGSTGNLAKYIKAEDGRDGINYWVGVGNIKLLSQPNHAPYWKVVNYGGYVPPANIGMFEDTGAPDGQYAGGTGKERWLHTGVGGEAMGMKFWYMKPKSPIRPMNYIQTTVSWLSVSMVNYFSESNLKILANVTKSPLESWDPYEYVNAGTRT